MPVEANKQRLVKMMRDFGVEAKSRVRQAEKDLKKAREDVKEWEKAVRALGITND